MFLTSNIQSFGDTFVWSFMVQVFILVIAMTIGNTIRRKVPFIRRSLMPTALIGGLLILVLKFVPAFNELISVESMEMLTYHSLGIGFIALALKTAKKDQNATNGKTVIETGLVTGATYLIQAIVGIGLTIVLAFVVDGMNPGGGAILALGFGQGTGQALNYGKLYESNFGFVGGETFGLTIATLGFIVSSVVGVIYMNILRKKGKLKIAGEDVRVEEKLDDYVSEGEIPVTESVDKFTINVSLVLVVYAVVYAIMRLININLIWGFNFLLGTIVAVVFRQAFNILKKKQIMHRELTNNFLLDRISGFMFDLMIIAGVAAIDLTELSNMMLPILLICAVGATVTFIFIRLAANHLYKGYEQEGFFSMFGMLTGTASNGMILLREIDPKFETPAATNLVMQSIPAIAFGGFLLLLLNYCPKGQKEALITIGVCSIAFVIYSLIIFRKAIFKKAYAKKDAKKQSK